MKNLALLTVCLLLVACSAGGNGGGGGERGQDGGGGNPGVAGTTGSGGQSAGGAGSGGQTGGNTGSGGSAGRGGAGGQGGGAGGQGGKAGPGGSGGGQSCSELQAAYGKAMVEAKACHTGTTQAQCTQLVSSQLTCCPTYVNDRTEIDKIYAQFQAAGCTPTIACPAVVCPVPTRAACVPINSGDWCMDVLTP